jgi:nucleotide-binding universal stress UspA family protein
VARGDRLRPVVVAVGDDADGHAVEWAAAEAWTRGCPLQVVHAQQLWWTVDPTGLIPVADLSTSRDAAEDILRTAVSRARAVAPDVDIYAEALFGCTARMLAAETRGAQLLVLGSRSEPFSGGVRGFFSRPLVGAVARGAACPVAVVRSLRSGVTAGAPRVVVCAHGAGEWAAALGVAFRAAAQRGVPVIAVQGVAPDTPADHEAIAGSAAVAEMCARTTLDRALQPWRHRFADVRVGTRLLAGDPAVALVRESQGAALVVIGFRARVAARDGGIGRVGRAAAGRAQCPVVVVRAARVRNRASAAPAGRAADAGAEHDGIEPARRWDTPWR